MIPVIAPILSVLAPVSPLDAIGSGRPVAAAPSAVGAPMDFGEMLTQVASDAVATLKKGEATAISGIEGKASVQQVVEAVMNAQQTLQTAIAIRDKVVSAYQDISRMAI
jgi:flagellar hook-basal body complex protein FliE